MKECYEGVVIYMADNEKGGFAPPKFDKLIWQCEKCGGFTSMKDSICKHCGAEKPEKKE
jgi:uncharacterized OB-fold protein